MATLYTYEDAYLDRFCTVALEARAITAVGLYGTFPAAWSERLVKVMAYIIACRDNQADEEDTFTLKLKTYSDMLSALLPLAHQAAADAADPDDVNVPIGFFTIPLARA